MTDFDIGGQTVGPGHPCFVIAEAGVNHNGHLDDALRLVDIAAASGADAVKFQTFAASRLVGPDVPKTQYQSRTTGSDGSQLEMLRRLELSEDDHYKIARHCEKCDIAFLSTPFDEESADFLDRLGVPAFKVASGEITNTPSAIGELVSELTTNDRLDTIRNAPIPYGDGTAAAQSVAAIARFL